MFRFATVLVLLLCSTNVIAADKIADYAKSSIMEDNKVTISTVSGKKVLQFEKGKNKSAANLKDVSFLADGQSNVVVVLPRFSPLKKYVKTEISAKEETIFDVSKVTAEVIKTAGSLTPGQKALMTVKEPAAGCFTTYSSAQRKAYAGISADYLKVVGNVDFKTIDLNKQEIGTWIGMSREKWLEIIADKGALSNSIDDYKSLIAKNGALLNGFIEKVEKSLKDDSLGFTSCASAYTVSIYTYLPSINLIKDKYLKQAEANKAFIEQLKKSLEAYKEDSKVIDEKNNIVYKWEGDNLNLSYNPPTRKNYMAVNLTYGDIKISIDELTVKEANPLVGNFEYHKREYIVPEVGTGYIYSGVRNKTWGTKAVNGQTVVVKSKDEAMIGHAAITLNGIIMPQQDWWIYPMVQFGIASDKDTPAFVTGVGFRVMDIPLAFAVGAIYSFNKELDNLKEGDVVSGTADIENNLKYHPTATWYIGLQYNF